MNHMGSITGEIKTLNTATNQGIQTPNNQNAIYLVMIVKIAAIMTNIIHPGRPTNLKDFMLYTHRLLRGGACPTIRGHRSDRGFLHHCE